MHDASLAATDTKSELTYPFSALPPTGQTVEVARGVHWLRMPLPFALNHINLWILEDGDGWTIVDTGMQTREIAEAWQSIISGPMAGRAVHRVICTHMHPDHIGMAGWLTRRFDCALWTTRLEYLTCRMLVSDTGRQAPPDAIRFYHGVGWNADSIEQYKIRFGGFGKMVYEMPDSYRRVRDNEEFLVNGVTWRAVVGRGHSPEHLCLYCPDRKVLISGDQVLPRITSNVSVFPSEPEADPLTEWLESIASIHSRVPDDVLVLPAHNEPFHGLHARLEQLRSGHERTLALLIEALESPQSAMDLFKILFRRPVSGDLLTMASGESVAHLNCLFRRGRVARSVDDSGIVRYRRL